MMDLYLPITIMNTIEETSIIVSLCKITLSELFFCRSADCVVICDIFDKISEEFNTFDCSPTAAASDANATEDGKCS